MERFQFLVSPRQEPSFLEQEINQILDIPLRIFPFDQDQPQIDESDYGNVDHLTKPGFRPAETEDDIGNTGHNGQIVEIQTEQSVSRGEVSVGWVSHSEEKAADGFFASRANDATK